LLINEALKLTSDLLRQKLKMENSIEALSDLSTIGIGGPAVIIRVKNEAQLSQVVNFHAQEGLKLAIIGGGSNLLFPDDGLLATGLILDGDFKRISVRNNYIEAGAGAATAKILELSQSQALTGLEFLAGLPGRVGGAVMGNAGAKNHGLAELVEEMELITLQGENLCLKREEIYPVYRSLNLPESLRGSIIKKVVLALRPSEADLVAKKIAQERKKRHDSQPSGPSLGCVFKNPPGKSAGQLIDSCGLKGETFGGAEISDKHANFIINAKMAKASDVWMLANLARSQVYQKYQIELFPEIKIWDLKAQELSLTQIDYWPGQEPKSQKAKRGQVKTPKI
jgi:UDP-N-acetylmuramate dehydrogenase